MKHNNISLSEDSQRIFKTKTGAHMESEVLGVITPVVPISPNPKIIKQNTATNSASETIYTTPSDKDFYLVACSLAVIKDASATSTASWLQVYIEGIATAILKIPSITLTAQTGYMVLPLPYPIKIDKNTAITINNGTAVANVLATGIIIGFTVEG